MSVQPEVEHHAVEVLARELASSASSRRRDRGDLDVVVADQLDDALALRLVVLDDEQVFTRSSMKRRDPVERVVERLLAHRLLEVRDRARA